MKRNDIDDISILDDDFNENDLEQSFSEKSSKKKKKIILIIIAVLICIISIVLACILTNKQPERSEPITTTQISEWKEEYDSVQKKENEEKYPDHSLPALTLN